ncbi:1-acyl-sn-glycerol-3-phosphate acyltransferase [bacterium]|nr:1-acyl-sn-glycerol-3-phosphate acyltransferase [bacterium]
MSNSGTCIRDNYDMTSGELFFHLYIAAPIIRALFALMWMTGILTVKVNGVILFYKGRKYGEFREYVLKDIKWGNVYIVAANHENRFHTIVAAWIADNLGLFTRKVVKDKYYKNKYLAKILFMTGSFPIDISKRTGDRKALQYGTNILKCGGDLLIFPEGTRGGQEIFDGAAYFAEKVRDKAMVLPIRISQQGYRIDIDMDNPFDLTQFSENRKECISQLSDKLASFFNKNKHIQ